MPLDLRKFKIWLIAAISFDSAYIEVCLLVSYISASEAIDVSF